MGDVVDMWRERREEQKAQRRTKLEKAEAEFERLAKGLPEWQKKVNLALVNHQPGQWLVRRDGRYPKTLVQYWPSADKWQVSATGKIHKGSIEKFEEFLIRGRF